MVLRRGAAEGIAEDAQQVEARQPGHLGHGLHPTIPVANVERLVDFVHEQSAR